VMFQAIRERLRPSAGPQKQVAPEETGS
jgi:hypothetical protein